jgi:hypothetical protein
MKQSVLGIIPRQFRARGYLVTFTILLRALLNFVGLAALLPVLYLILDSENIHSNRYLSEIYDTFGFGSDTSFVASVTAAMLLFITLKCLVNLALYRFERDYIYALYRYLSRNLYIDYFNRGLSFIKSSNSAVLSRNVNVVCYTFVAGVLRPLASIFSEAMLFAMLFAAILIYNPTAALLTVAIFVPSVWLYFALVRKRVNRYGDIENEAQRTKYRNVVETYRGYTDIEINNAFPKMLSSFDRSIDTIIDVGAKNATVSTLPQIFTEIGLAAGMSLLVTMSVGSGSGDMKILFGIFAVAALRLLPSIRSIMAAWTALRYNRYTIDIIRDADINKTSTVEDTANDRFEFRDSIEIDNLSFRFADSDKDTLHGLSFEIRKGEKIGIKGRSGAGKTTLFNLLLGFYRPTGGGIRIDGELLSESNRRKWQNTIGYVSQSVFLTDNTILANIALGCDEASVDLDRVNKAVDMANLREFVDSLPNGLQSRIGECGALLSGGQRQRIGIARALYKRADILFFDEATSSLDSDTERGINESIKTLSRNNDQLTIIIIAHRESSLDCCDRIIEIK